MEESTEDIRDAIHQARELRLRHEREDAAEPGLEQFYTEWNGISDNDTGALLHAMDNAKRERDMQRFLQNHPLLLVQALRGGHGRWVIPQKRLGSEFVTDFMVAQKSSIGFEWTPIELESTKARLFNKNGDISPGLNHGVRQIIDWRTWLTDNLSYARRPRTENGLGLVDIDPQAEAWLIIGRRSTVSEDTRARRNEYGRTLSIQIHTYDWLLRTAMGRVTSLRRYREQRTTRKPKASHSTSQPHQ